MFYFYIRGVKLVKVFVSFSSLTLKLYGFDLVILSLAEVVRMVDQADLKYQIGPSPAI